MTYDDGRRQDGFGYFRDIRARTEGECDRAAGHRPAGGVPKLRHRAERERDAPVRAVLDVAASELPRAVCDGLQQHP
jgi:hypothetical protein